MAVIDLAALAPERLRPLRRVEYERLVELGCFEDEKIELLDGSLVAAGVTSYQKARARMAYETWWSVHLYTYLALFLS